MPDLQTEIHAHGWQDGKTTASPGLDTAALSRRVARDGMADQIGEGHRRGSAGLPELRAPAEGVFSRSRSQRSGCRHVLGCNEESVPTNPSVLSGRVNK